MFKDKTVFITGAGASYHYGYPTGEQIIGAMRNVALQLQRFYEAMAHSGYGNVPEYFKVSFSSISTPRLQYRAGLKEVEDFLWRLRTADPLVIDYFLGQNLQLEEIGKILIAWVILEAESKQKIQGNWIRFISHALALGCRESRDILNNKVSFISFNYDTSLERYLSNALRALSIFQERDIDVFMDANRFNHVYGSVNDGVSPFLSFDNVYSGGDLSSLLNKTIQVLNPVYEASRGLSVIDPEFKKVDDNVIAQCRSIISDADKIFFVGFGFDEVNSKLLNLERLINENNKTICLTNYGDVQRVNFAIGNIFFKDKSPFFGYNRAEGRAVLWKSTKSTYDALGSDFIIP